MLDLIFRNVSYLQHFEIIYLDFDTPVPQCLEKLLGINSWKSDLFVRNDHGNYILLYKSTSRIVSVRKSQSFFEWPTIVVYLVNFSILIQ